MNWRTFALAGIVLVAVSCRDVTGTDLRSIRRFSNVCDVSLRDAGREGPGRGKSVPADTDSVTSLNNEEEYCALSDDPGETYDYAQETDEPATNPDVWNGETNLPTAEQAICPEGLLGNIEVFHAGSQIFFKFGPAMIKVADAPSMTGMSQYPHAWYEPTSDPVSRDGTKYLANARVRLACIGWIRSTSRWGITVRQGQVVVGGATGVPRNRSFGGGPGQDNEMQGWANVKSSGTGHTGAGTGWETAAHNWFWHRSCTAGFATFEEGVQVCTGLEEMQ